MAVDRSFYGGVAIRYLSPDFRFCGCSHVCNARKGVLKVTQQRPGLIRHRGVYSNWLTRGQHRTGGGVWYLRLPCYADRVCGKRTKTVPCPSVRPSVPGAARAAAAKPFSGGRCASSALQTTRGPRKFRSDCQEVQRTCLYSEILREDGGTQEAGSDIRVISDLRDASRDCLPRLQLLLLFLRRPLVEVVEWLRLSTHGLPVRSPDHPRYSAQWA